MTEYAICCRRTGRRSVEQWPFWTLAVLAALAAGLVEFDVIPVKRDS